MKHDFGLIERKYETGQPGDEDLTQWQRFEKYITSLTKASTADTKYKVLYVGRHGEGYRTHPSNIPPSLSLSSLTLSPDNVGEAKYGTKAWDDYWSKLDGDGELFWVDAHLTDKGKHQALDNHSFLKRQFGERKMPSPQKYYSSPLYRCLQTANFTYSGLDLPSDRPFVPVVKEMLREVMGEHTCDRRSSKTIIHDAFPDFPIEPGFAEEDELWEADHRETHPEHDIRTRRLLEDVFEHDDTDDAFVSFTSHSGSIASLLRVLGHHEFKVPTGGMMPIFVRATRTTS
jgi:broad specificity phosphatase PhoE